MMGTPIGSGCLLSLRVHASDDILGLLGLPVRKLVLPFVGLQLAAALRVLKGFNGREQTACGMWTAKCWTTRAGFEEGREAHQRWYELEFGTTT
jgi:hypothetical protein